MTASRDTLFTENRGVPVAYSVEGSGSPLVLLHGGMGGRRDWEKYGYTQALRESHTLILVDHRGHGESGKPTSPEDYSVEALIGDVHAAADACGAESFSVLGFSYGGTLALNLAASSRRVERAAALGASFGSVLTPGFAEFIKTFKAFWAPRMADLRSGTLDAGSLPKERRDQLGYMDVPAWYAIVHALGDWPAVEPSGVLCPLLMLVGSENPDAFEGNKPYLEEIRRRGVEYRILEGLNHWREFTESEAALPHITRFLGETL